MSFTIPCFIRKNTPELRKRLSDLGYRQCLYSEDDGCIVTESNIFTSINDEDFDNKEPMPTWNKSGRIDCGDNEELFLALAALRDDSDYMQYFTNGTDFIKCERKKWLDVLRAVFGDRNEYMDELGKYHKATPTEIIAHFKQK